MDPLDLLNNDLTNVSTSIPMLPEKVLKFSVSELKLEKTKEGSDILNIKLKLEEDKVLTIDGVTYVNKGFPIFDGISLKASDSYDPQRRLKEFRLAVTGQEGGAFAPLEQYVNKIVNVKIRIEAERTDKETGKTYEARNRVKSYING